MIHEAYLAWRTAADLAALTHHGRSPPMVASTATTADQLVLRAVDVGAGPRISDAAIPVSVLNEPWANLNERARGASRIIGRAQAEAENPGRVVHSCEPGFCDASNGVPPQRSSVLMARDILRGHFSASFGVGTMEGQNPT